ncbi:2-oxoglutarate and iron-dependent oxygenase domain-containing protein [Leifsonia bigeumensis]|uniref:2-oxoglutarate and iron-dependent oxygenase domain-containing protein n=1 Tax=Leifsonella bigeumensis TaxID=433643 RepID=A0ABP7F5A9_9MICO
MTTPIAVPTINIDRDPAVVGREFDETLREVGFFQIVDHGVPDEVADRCWEVTRSFFDLPLEEKLSVERQEGGLYGYFPMLTESLAQSLDAMAPGDLKESFNMGPGVVAGHKPADETEASLFSANRWPAALPEFKPVWEAYYAAMSTLANRLMTMFAHGLDLPADFFADKIDRSPSALRAINYPEQSAPPEDGQLRAGAHTDYGTLTILRQELGRAGLQVRDDHSDAWVDIPPTPGALVINIGDLMARWTNDRWTSTLHRVVNPDAGSAVSTRRQSMPFFHNANYSALVECLPSSLAAGETPKYEPVLAGPHLAGKSHKAVG